MAIKRLSFLFSLTIVTCSCTMHDGLSPQEESEVLFAPVSVSIAATKASSISSLPQNSNVSIAAYPVIGGNENTVYSTVKAYTVSDAVGTLSASDGSNMKLFSGVTYQFYEYTPIVSFCSESTKSLSISHGTDLMASSLQNTIGTGTQTLSMPPLSHQCCLVEFDTKLDASNTKITSLAIGTGGYTVSGVTHSPQNYMLGSGFDLAKAVLDGSYNIPQTAFSGGSNSYSATICLLPKATATFDFSFNLLLNGNSCRATAVIPSMPFLAGTKYTFIISVIDSEMMLQLNISSWNAVTDTNDLGGGGITLNVGSWAITTQDENIGDGNFGIVTINDWVFNPALTESMGNGGFGIIMPVGWTSVDNDNNLGN